MGKYFARLLALTAVLAMALPSYAGNVTTANTETTYAVSFSYAAADGTGAQSPSGTIPPGCRSGVAYLQDGSTGQVKLHGTPGSATALSAATEILEITSAGLAGAVAFSDMPARYFRFEITTIATTSSQLRIQCTNAG